ncbi:TcpQ domain-containing protein [Psychrosphaera aestuarii]|uniref:TcpQ domain-containing protein n=1 Tax=Psychrosphaera aestuarii TaxID=1266052 RepID=UPI001B32D025|nr:TcpQ domain-containing protein [Psychrosphaera aestuarii]
MDKNKSKKKQSGYLGKILAPVIFILIIVGFVYWGSDESNKTSENAVAKGVAKFYAEVRQALKPGAERLNDYTIKLPEPEQSMVQQLASLDGTVEPASDNWQGASIKRSFKQNDTLKTALETYARTEGMELIWDLKYDYIVKEHFTESSDFKSLVNKISSVVSGDYSGQVKTYFCKDARALVITDKTDTYISKHCQPTR